MFSTNDDSSDGKECLSVAIIIHTALSLAVNIISCQGSEGKYNKYDQRILNPNDLSPSNNKVIIKDGMDLHILLVGLLTFYTFITILSSLLLHIFIIVGWLILFRHQFNYTVSSLCVCIHRHFGATTD